MNRMKVFFEALINVSDNQLRRSSEFWFLSVKDQRCMLYNHFVLCHGKKLSVLHFFEDNKRKTTRYQNVQPPSTRCFHPSILCEQFSFSILTTLVLISYTSSFLFPIIEVERFELM